MHLPRPFYLVLLLLNLQINFVFSQEIDVVNYNAPGRITSMYADNDTVWIGTFRTGLYKRSIHGEMLKQYKMDNGLASNTISDIVTDNDGKVWVASGNGISVIDGNSVGQHNVDDGLASNDIRCLAVSPGGDLWVGTGNAGISVYKEGGWTTYSEADGLYSNQVKKIVVDNNMNIWCSHPAGVSRFDGANWLTVDTLGSISDIEASSDKLWVLSDKIYYWNAAEGSFSDTLAKPAASCHDLAFGDNNSIFTASVNGIYTYNDGEWALISDFESETYDTQEIMFDKNNELWAAVDNKLLFYNGINWLTYSALETDGIFDIYIEGNNKKWIATGDGLYEMDNEDWKHFPVPFDNQLINYVAKDSRENIWVSNNGKVGRFDGSEWKVFSPYNPLGLERDKDGNLWFGTWYDLYQTNDTGIVCYDLKPNFNNNSIMKIKPDSAGNIWISTSATTYKFDGETLSDLMETDNFPHISATAINIDKSGKIWFANAHSIFDYENGLFVYDGQDIQQHYNEYEINDIEFDTLGNAWLASRYSGLVMFDGSQYFEFNEDDGIPSNTIYNIAIDSKGYIWLATPRGMSKVKFTPGEASTDNVKSVLRENLEVYPNPSVDVLYIKTNIKEACPLIVSIYDISGKIVLKRVFHNASDILRVDLSGISRGFYLVNTRSANGNFNATRRIVHQ